MRRIALILLTCILLTGCSDDSIDPALHLRRSIQNSTGYEFDAEIVADYSDEIYVFSMHCKVDEKNVFHFEVTSPQTIAGISGYIDGEGGYLTFDDKILAFELMADGQFSPVSAPWVLMKALSGGYIRAGGKVENGTKLIINDTYSEDALQVDIWLDLNNKPEFAEILWDGRRILSVKVANFQILSH